MIYEYLYSVKKYSISFLLLIALIFFSAGFLIISLCTYYPTDPSLLYHSTESTIIHNKAGFCGAHLSALLYFLFGTSALILALFLLFFASILFLNGTVKKNRDQLIGWFLFFMSSCMLGAWYHASFMHTGFLPGGVLGQALLARIIGYDQFLVGFCIHGFLFISIILITRASILKIPHYGMVFFYQLKIIKKIPYYLSGFSGVARLYNSTKDRLIRWIAADNIFNQEQVVNEKIADHAIWNSLPEKNNERNVKKITIEPERVEKKIQTIQQDAESIPFQLPPSSLFVQPDITKEEQSLAKRHEQLAAVLEEKLQRFGVQGRVIGIKAGPVVTLFEYQPHIDAKVSKILALEDDLALALQAISIRIIAPIPGRSLVGFEVANQTRLPVYFSQLTNSVEWQKTGASLPLVLGVDTGGNKMIADLAAMPHLLIAGSTGSGKSVALNAMLVSLLCKRTPEQLRLILIDPKRLEFAAYAEIPHLLFPIVDDAKQASVALKWAVQEMERRYQVLATAGVRHIYDYQKLCTQEQDREQLPLIVIIIDELSDLMMVAAKEVELRIARIAQMARAAGIHLIVATQRPSVDVITGIIKVNFPSRIAFKVSSKIDSRIILDCAGADKLLGKGDMLYLDAAGQITRVHGAFISDKERESVAAHVRSQQAASYCDIHELVTLQEGDDIDESDQDLYKEVVEFLKSVDEVSISLLQRKFRIGYNRSARIIDTLQAQGLIISTEGGKTRKVLR